MNPHIRQYLREIDVTIPVVVLIEMTEIENGSEKRIGQLLLDNKDQAEELGFLKKNLKRIHDSADGFLGKDPEAAFRVSDIMTFILNESGKKWESPVEQLLS